MHSEFQTKSLGLRVLNAYHPRVLTLLAYLEDAIDVVSVVTSAAAQSSGPSDDHATINTIRNHIHKEGDPPAYVELITKTCIGDDCTLKMKMKISSPAMSMVELIDRAQARLFTKAKKPSNVITAGYRSAPRWSEIGKESGGIGRQGLTNFFVNTMVDALQAPEWEILLERVGEVVILHLLTETSLYSPLPNDCFCQLTGPPLIYIAPPRLPGPSEGNVSLVQQAVVYSRKRKSSDGEEDTQTRPKKRRRVKPLRSDKREASIPQHEEAETKAKSRSAAEIHLTRVSLFYARPCRHAKSAVILLGLPIDHVFHRMKTIAWRESKGLRDNGDGKNGLRPGDLDGALEARHLSKYLFPLQYKLDNVFLVPPERLREEQFERGRFANREEEIHLKGSCKTPTRLKNILPLLSQIFNKHKKCGYKPLLDIFCPSKLKHDHLDSTVDSSIILDLISEEVSESRFQTQISFDRSNISDSTSLSMFGGSRSYKGSLSKANSQMKYKPKFAEFTCSYAEVFLYARAVTKAVIPYALWGCAQNRKIMMLHVKQFITGRRYEGMTLHDVIQGISTSECDWLLPPSKPKPSQQLNQSMAEMLKRRELLEEFLFWYFDQFLLPLLRTTFYVTESSAFRNRILYFRQDDWDVLCQPLLDRLAATTFRRIHQHEAEELLRQRKLGYSFVRLLPKDSGVRPIVNLRRKRKSDNPYEQNQSINQILSAAFQILTYEKSMQSEQLGASVFGPNEIYLRLKDFKKNLMDASGKIPKLYFVKVDVQACFDTIEQGKLLGILKALISEDAYMIQKYGQILPTTGKIKRTFAKKAMPEYEHPHFLTYAAQLAALLRHAILVDQVVYPFAFRDDILQLLEDHITSNIVKIGQDYYRQNIGIPQGSVLSSLLCSFFYGDFERTALRFVAEAQNNVLLRLIDDYLFITTDVGDARRFLDLMNKGHPEYGCFIAREKTLTNFDHNVGNMSQLGLSTVLHPEHKLFPWCGYLINTDDLSVTNDYSRFHETYLTDSLTVERSRRPNTAFVQKMLQIAKAKTHIIFTDTSHNAGHAVRANVYQAFVLAAMKMHAYTRAAGRGPGSGGLAFALGGGAGAGHAEGGRGLDGRKSARTSGAFLLGVIRQSIRYTYASIKNKASGKLARQAGSRCDITKDEVVWLGTHAFHSVLSIKRTVYTHAGVLGALRTDLERARFRGLRRKLKGIARESLEKMLKDIPFRAL